ncbi:MAG: hypothetical protein NVS9B13_17870 [Candidatus Acidiferrum sp.]
MKEKKFIAAANRSVRKPELLLLFIFFLSLALLNPWVRGDGVGYYAFLRAPLIEHNLDFSPDYQAANKGFRDSRLDDNGVPKDVFRTRTGHLDNHFTVGPAILWTPFLLLAHGGVLLARAMGSSVQADGFSEPYRIAMALGTALYGFAGLLLSFRLARKYIRENCALLATIGIWWASSLPVYMYFNPSWSHAHSAFAVALFLWYWDATRGARSTKEWIVLGAITGLMLNVYYANLMILVVLAVEAIRSYVVELRGRKDGRESIFRLLLQQLLFGFVVVICLAPTFITRSIVYGGPFESGYVPLKNWLWRSPVFLQVLFSANHGLFSWTPLLLFSVIGLFIFWRRFPDAGAPFLGAALAFYIFISCYPDWAGIASFGNRFFVSLTPLFIIGLAALLERFALVLRARPQFHIVSVTVIACFILWNLGFFFQWGSHLIPVRGPIQWNTMVYNQFHVVPVRLGEDLQSYFFKRRMLMQQIEQRDIEQRREQAKP